MYFDDQNNVVTKPRPVAAPAAAPAPAAVAPAPAVQEIEDNDVLTSYAGFTPPFTLSYVNGAHWVDANGKTVPPDAVKEWEQHGKPAGTGPGGVVSAVDMKLALDQYRAAIAKSNTQYDAILGHVPAPSPSTVLTLPTGETVDPSKVAQVSPAQRLQATLQRTPTVATTTLATGQADQARSLGVQNIQDLQATAQGAGAGQQAAAARLQLALQRSSQLASGMAAQARGSERRGLRREALVQGGQRNLEGQAQLEAQAAQERQAAQGQLGQQIQATRTTDVDVAGKKASLEAERKTLQAQLDQARASNDQNAINSLKAKQADLDQRTKEVNALATNQTQARSEEQAFEGQKLAVDRGLEVSRLTEEQRVANERLKLDASKAAQDAAQGLLTENARQEQLAFAREQLRVATDQADRQFWGNLISSLLSGGAAVGAAAVTKSDRRAKEAIEPVKDADLGELLVAVRKSLATWKYKKGEGPPGEHAGPMAQDLEKTRLGRAVVSEDEDGKKGVDYGALATLLAAATVKARKREAR